jgi:hypothetical protein
MLLKIAELHGTALDWAVAREPRQRRRVEFSFALKRASFPSRHSPQGLS